MRKKILILSSLLLSCFLIGFYIFQLNSLTTLAWRVAETEDFLTQLKHENTALQQKAYQALSIGDLERIASDRQFVKISSVTYLQITGGPVAQSQ
jgi:hypothetical protein